MVLQKQPELILNVLSNHSDLSLDYICFELENPVNEGIDVNKAYIQVTHVNNYKKEKDRILKAIKTALDKID